MTAPVWVPWTMLAMTLVSSYLLVAEIPFFSLKFHDFSWKNNLDKYIFLIGNVILIAFCITKAAITHHWEFAFFAGAAVIVWYVVLNLLTNIIIKK